MSIRNAERAVERLFTFDDREWTREDLIACATRDTGDLLVRVLQELRVAGIGSADVQRGIINDRFWGAAYDDNMPLGQGNADSRRGTFRGRGRTHSFLNFVYHGWTFPLSLLTRRHTKFHAHGKNSRTLYDHHHNTHTRAHTARAHALTQTPHISHTPHAHTYTYTYTDGWGFGAGDSSDVFNDNKAKSSTSSTSIVEDIQPFSPSESEKREDNNEEEERSPRLRHRQATSASAKKKNSMVLEEIDIDDFDDDFGDDFI
jgi:hypothetical protein